jgi:hypothetical protein
MKKPVFGAIVLVTAMLVASPGWAQEAFFGVWKVIRAEPAPWVEKIPNRETDINPAIRYGKIVIAKDRFSSPVWPSVYCDHPRYRVDKLQRNQVFEGGLYDPEYGITNTNELAKKYGFDNDSIDTLEYGCVGPDLHMNKVGNIVFAFYNNIYTAERVK